jgi:hypothetical protein
MEGSTATRMNRTTRVGPVLLLLLAGCSRASLLGGPGPEVEHHASPAQSERLAVAEPVRKFDSKDGCRARLQALAGEHGGEIVQISDNEYRAYASKPWGEKELHHEYSCVGKALTERSWYAGAADAQLAEEAH